MGSVPVASAQSACTFLNLEGGDQTTSGLVASFFWLTRGCQGADSEMMSSTRPSHTSPGSLSLGHPPLALTDAHATGTLTLLYVRGLTDGGAWTAAFFWRINKKSWHQHVFQGKVVG